MKKSLIIMSILLFMGSMALHAQTRQISGAVIAADDDQPIPGVSVYVKGSTLGTTTDVDGEYTLEVPDDASTLVFSFIGMKTLELPIPATGDGVVDATLQPDVLGLDEVLVVAYGTTRKASLTGSAAVVGADKIEGRSVSSIGQILTGSTTGVQTTAGSGQPGSSPSIRIRGVGTLNTSASPLIILDGAEYAGSLASINPSDIESMTILKDASSTALYGSRAANGVIIITTKKGTKGDESMTVNFKAQGGLIDQALPYYESVNAFDFYELQAEAYAQSRYASGSNANIGDARTYAYENIFSQLRYNPFVGTPND
ncbi:MAG: carboxypeptidase-like regulatory domain-containing protein, partial [Kosmotogaceae bacterium]